MISPQLEAIRASVMQLVDHIELAQDEHPPGRWIDRHPLAFAIASLGVELLGSRLLARARRLRNAAPAVRWWNPPDSEGMVH